MGFHKISSFYFNFDDSKICELNISSHDPDLILQNQESDPLTIMNSENDSSSSTLQAMSSSRDSFESIFNNVMVDKLITIIIKKHDKGVSFDQIKQIINQKILKFNQEPNELINWLKRNQDKVQYVWFLGLFYYYGIDMEENGTKGFELFSKASEKNHPISQVYLARCYNDGYGTECNKKFAF